MTIDGAARRVGLTRPMIEALKERIALGRAGGPDEAAGGIFLFCIPSLTMSPDKFWRSAADWPTESEVRFDHWPRPGALT